MLNLPDVKQGCSDNNLKLVTGSQSEKGEAMFLRQFEYQVESTPDAIAVSFQRVSLTYFELNRRANKLARFLRTLGVCRETLVALCYERCTEMLISIIAVLKAGGAYLPIDPSYPISRIYYMLEDGGLRYVLTSPNYNCIFDAYKSQAVKDELQIIQPHEYGKLLAKQSSANLALCPSGNSLAYVMYTSGSTGNPKGIMIEHAGIYNRLEWMVNYFSLNETDKVLQKTSYSFDISVWELLCPLLVGAEVVFAAPEEHKNPKCLLRIIQSREITTLHFVPSMLNIFLDSVDIREGSSLRRVICSGEALSASSINDFFNQVKGVELYNMYGPTEASVDISYWQCHPNLECGNVPIGKPISNMRIYVLDKELKPVSVGQVGELCLSGIGLARGYLNKPEITKENFLDNPFSSGEHDKRLYKTGDLGYCDEAGYFYFSGRIDNQIKFQGFRIELEEIERHVCNITGVKQAIVVKHLSEKGDFLVCYLTLNKEVYEIDAMKIKHELANKLPYYMVPSRFITIPSMPITVNHKVDRKALSLLPLPLPVPVPVAKQAELQSIKGYSVNYVSLAITSHIGEVLNLNHKLIDIGDNFFSLGGNSIDAITVVNNISRCLSVDIKVCDLYKACSISAFINTVVKQIKNKKLNLEARQSVEQELELLPLLPSQQDMWLASEVAANKLVYNTALQLNFKNHLKPNLLELAFEKVIQRHECLRALFVLKGRKLYQKICPLFEIKKQILPLSVIHAASKKQLLENIQDFVNRPFDLTKQFPIRLRIFLTEKREHVLIICIHHIATDSWSNNIIVSDLLEAYKNLDLSKLPSTEKYRVSYSDYVKQYTKLPEQLMQQQLQYWSERLADLPYLSLPKDYSKQEKMVCRGDYVYFKINNRQHRLLKLIAKNLKTTLFTVLLTLLDILLAYYTRQRDIVVGIISAGRANPKSYQLVGAFINTIIVRSRVEHDSFFKDLVATNHTLIHEALNNQEIPFYELVQKSVFAKSASVFPQVLFNFEPLLSENCLLNELGVTLDTVDLNYAMTEVTLFLKEKSDCINGKIQFCSELFNSSTIASMVSTFLSLINAVVEDDNRQFLEFEHLMQRTKFSEAILVSEIRSTSDLDYELLHVMFESQVNKTPDRVAVSDAKCNITYSELNKRANQMAHYLNKLSLGNESPIGVLLEQTVYVPIAILACLKSGCTYVPLNKNDTKKQLKALIYTCGIQCIIGQTSLTSKIDSKELTLITMDASDACFLRESNSNLNTAFSANKLAYIMHTSGSTGARKGVSVEHASVINVIRSIAKEIELTANDKLLSFTPTSFDISVLELLMPVLYGAQLFIADVAKIVGELNYLKNLLINLSPTVIQTTPSIWHIILKLCPDYVGKLKILCGGEMLPIGLAKELAIYGKKSWNVYGPTETTIWSTCAAITFDKLSAGIKSFPIGKPIANTQVYILDSQMKPVPMSVIGHLYISGIGVARNCYNQVELTQEKFFSKKLGRDRFTRVYKTGDLARRLPDGNIEYIGRADRQVKLRGVRVELSDIENQILSYSGIKEAAVVVPESNNTCCDELYAYIVFEKELKDSSACSENYDEITGQWRKVFDNTYFSSSQKEQEGINIAGWNRSVDNTAIPENEMREWIDNTVERIQNLAPRSIFEIGCGNGLLLSRLAPAVEKYVASDIAQGAIDEIRLKIAPEILKSVCLINKAAHQPLEVGQVDTVILNSVIQYFPSAGYLSRVIQNAMNCLTDSGQIFIGDVRSLLHLKLFFKSLCFEHSNKQLDSDFDQYLRYREKELVVVPQLFINFAKILPEISGINVELKQGSYVNELSQFRYDLTIYKNKPFAQLDVDYEVDWQEYRLSLFDMEEIIRTKLHSKLIIRNIVNARLISLSSQDLRPDVVDGIFPDSLYQLAKKFKLYGLATWPSACDPMLFDMIFSIKPQISHSKIDSLPAQNNMQEVSNHPYAVETYTKIMNDLFRKLKKKIPEYMLPSAIIILDEMPLTPHGKIDLNHLASLLRVSNKRFLPSRTQSQSQCQLASIWAEFLPIKKISLNDNFFDLGGHSLLAVQIVHKIKQQFDVDIRVSDLQQNPTLQALAAYIDTVCATREERVTEPAE